MNSTTAAEPTSSSLKEALCAQQKLLQKLYNELDVEREAAATAASEAMSMILRLQGEKAAVKMEAEQYKRLAEEKMNHVEESMETLDEIMYQKEMEIASLDYQVQAYRYRLLSLGYDDLGAHEIKFPEYLLQRNESLVGETSSKTPPPRRLTLPNLNLKKGQLERDRSITEDSDTIAKIVEESLREDEHNEQNEQNQSADQGLKHNKSFDVGLRHNQSYDFGLKTEFPSLVDISSYLEQIRELDRVVGQVAGDEYQSSIADKTSRCSSYHFKLNELDAAQPSQKSVDDKISADTCSPSVCDVFEVPVIEETLCKDEGKSTIKDEGKSIFQIDDGKSIFKDEGKSNFKDEGKSNFKDEGKSIIKDDGKSLFKIEGKSTPKDEGKSTPKEEGKSIFKEEGKSIFKDEGKSIFRVDEKLKRLTSFTQSPIKSYHKHEIDPEKKGIFSRYKKRKVLFTHGVGTNAETVEQSVGQEKVTSREERELRLLNEMNEKLDSIQSEIRCRNTKVNKSSSNYDLHMLMLREALWDLWI